MAVKVILAGQFKLPEDSQLISAIYWISASEEFLRQVGLNIQHCAVIGSGEECTKFSFVITKCSQKELPYIFRKKEAVFNPHTQYATIKLKQFSFVAPVRPANTEIRYAAFKFYRQISTVNTVLSSILWLSAIFHLIYRYSV